MADPDYLAQALEAAKPARSTLGTMDSNASKPSESMSPEERDKALPIFDDKWNKIGYLIPSDGKTTHMDPNHKDAKLYLDDPKASITITENPEKGTDIQIKTADGKINSRHVETSIELYLPNGGKNTIDLSKYDVGIIGMVVKSGNPTIKFGEATKLRGINIGKNTDNVTIEIPATSRLVEAIGHAKGKDTTFNKDTTLSIENLKSERGYGWTQLFLDECKNADIKMTGETKKGHVISETVPLVRNAKLVEGTQTWGKSANGPGPIEKAAMNVNMKVAAENAQDAAGRGRTIN